MNRAERRRQKGGGRKRKGRLGQGASRALDEAVRLHEQGNLGEARQVYETLLDTDPKNYAAWHYLGLTDLQMGDLDTAIARISRAVELRPRYPGALNNLGLGLQAVGRAEEAAEAYRKAIRFQPDMADAHHNLGNALGEMGDNAAARKSYANALRLRPDFPEVHYAMAGLHREAGDFDAAIAAYRKALEARPELIEALRDLGGTLLLAGQLDEAKAALRDAADRDPTDPETLSNLAMTLVQMNDLDGAVDTYEKALAIDPEHVGALSGLGTAYQRLGRRDEAQAQFRRCVELEPDAPAQRFNLGTHLAGNGQAKEAAMELSEATRLDADHVPSIHALGLIEMAEGKWADGWPKYLRRRDMPDAPTQNRKKLSPFWTGEALAGRSIYLWGDQGLGEHIIFAGLLAEVAAEAERVRVECEPRLEPLLSRSFPDIDFITKTALAADPGLAGGFDLYTNLSDIGCWLRPTPDAFPPMEAYLSADPAKVAPLRERYRESGDEVLVGISWYSANKEFGFKSMPLLALRSIMETHGARFIDLQYGDTSAERTAFAEETGIDFIHDDAVDQMTDLDLFAAQVAAMDMVITISNTTAHFAGALGVPTLLMLETWPLWYWMTTGARSPWYADVEIFRQTTRGDWSDVIDAVGERFTARMPEAAARR